MWNLHDGIDWTSAVTTLLIHRFARPPLIRPQVYATYWKLKNILFVIYPTRHYDKPVVCHYQAQAISSLRLQKSQCMFFWYIQNNYIYFCRHRLQKLTTVFTEFAFRNKIKIQISETNYIAIFAGATIFFFIIFKFAGTRWWIIKIDYK